ncbi:MULTISPECIES: hypothetical protein [unclassified Streptomyces]|nr:MULTISPECIES: hypothetical protein [unclassified Streptomyces]MCX5103774.1 hypothetical protein [Streptomyces sp. NBC_00439]WSC32011.1 hypothetical protein OG902_37870 [Streptomyces sp. NBC_01768]WSX06044.1 hypothetical protein OG355_39445 [Streptomyces sp. NBC_00987]
MSEQSPIAATLAQAGTRRRRIRTQHGVTLSAFDQTAEEFVAGES